MGRARMIDPKTEVEINMTAMIDVVFLLIIFFILINDMSQQELEDLKLPVAMTAVEDSKPDMLRPILNISWEGEVVFKRETVHAEPGHPMYEAGRHRGMRFLHQRLANFATLMEVGEDGYPENPVLMRADASTPFRLIQEIMFQCGQRDVQIWKLQLAVSEDPNKAKG